MVLGCSNREDELKFNQYLKEINVVDKIENGLYVFIPLNTCNNCINEVKELLEKNKLKNSSNIKIIIIDYSSKKIKDFTNKLNNYYSIYEDIKLTSIKKGLIDGSSVTLYLMKKYLIYQKFDLLINKSLKEGKKIILDNYELKK